MKKSQKLTNVKNNAHVCISKCLDPDLEKLGFHEGCILCVIKNDNINPLIILLKDSKIAIGRDIAEKIEVK